MTEFSVVREALGDRNYAIWSNCMEIYLMSQDLWDIIEEEENESKSWKIKNALALHAIHMSCDTAALSRIGTLKSAKEAWYVLRWMNRPSHDDDEEVTVKKPLQTIPEEQSSKDEDAIDYAPFVKATKEENWRDMKEFLDSHPEADLSVVVEDGRTALHHVLNLGNIAIGKSLVEKMKEPKDLEILDDKHRTAFAYLANHNQPGVLDLLKLLVSKNKDLPNIGNHFTVPVVMASWKGFKDLTRYLYSVTNKDIFDPQKTQVGVELLVSCINIRLFGIASEIVTKFPKILQKQSCEKISPIHALAKCFSALENGRRHKKSRLFKLNHWRSKTWKFVERLLLGDEDIFEESDDEKLVYNEARDFLRLVCAQVSSFDVAMLAKYVCEAMVEASKNGVAKFVSEMLIANPILVKAHTDGNFLFGHAIENRQEKIYSLIYNFIGEKDYLLSNTNSENNNILHLVAKLPPAAVLDRSSGPALQMQRELQWFQEVWNLAKPRYREDLNKEKLTPRALFTETHAKLMEDGEKAMKDTAQSSTVVGALIVTIMFAAAFTVPGGNNQDSGLPVFSRRTLFRIFIVCDALSLYSSTTSVLMFLGILTSRYAEQDFFLKLPRKLIIGLATLFFSITTMMITFCTALALMLDGQLRYILPTVLLACVPIIMFMSSIVPVLSEMFMSTFGPSIFDKSPKILEKIEAKKVKDKKLPVEEARDNLLKDTDRTEQEYIVNDPTSVDKNKDKNILYDPSSSNKV